MYLLDPTDTAFRKYFTDKTLDFLDGEYKKTRSENYIGLKEDITL